MAFFWKWRTAPSKFRKRLKSINRLKVNNYSPWKTGEKVWGSAENVDTGFKFPRYLIFSRMFTFRIADALPTSRWFFPGDRGRVRLYFATLSVFRIFKCRYFCADDERIPQSPHPLGGAFCLGAAFFPKYRFGGKINFGAKRQKTFRKGIFLHSWGFGGGVLFFN